MRVMTTAVSISQASLPPLLSNCRLFNYGETANDASLALVVLAASMPYRVAGYMIVWIALALAAENVFSRHTQVIDFDFRVAAAQFEA